MSIISISLQQRSEGRHLDVPLRMLDIDGCSDEDNPSIWGWVFSDASDAYNTYIGPNTLCPKTNHCRNGSTRILPRDSEEEKAK